ncbi:MAG: type II secretion system protein [Clostridiales bacterium]|nr:type II secretion system protein [Clostridiales bacterium]
MLCRKKISRRGFTLLETMLSVALLMIVSLITLEGFMSTLSYAADTALAERFSNVNAGKIYQSMGATSNCGAQDHPGGSSTTALCVYGTGFKSIIQVNVINESSGSSGFSSTSLMQDANFKQTATRHGFTYLARGGCSAHPDLGLQYFVETNEDGDKVIIGKCPNASCDYSVFVRNYPSFTAASST